MQIYAASHLLPISAPPLAGGAIAVDNGEIVAVGTLEELRGSYAAPVTEFPGCVIMPGLVNPHTHLELTHFPSWKLRKGVDYAPRTYVDWVIQVIKIRRALTSAEVASSIREGIYRSLECGTTMVGEIVTDRSFIDVYGRYPLNGRLYCEAIGQAPDRCAELLHALDHALWAFQERQLYGGLSPHAPHTLSPGFFRDVVALAARHHVPTAIHLAESPEESTFIISGGGPIAGVLYPSVGWGEYSLPRAASPTAYLDALGVLNARTTVIHCVHVAPEDAEILKRSGACAVLCPRSNDRLVVGKAPAALLKEAGIPLALGTDSLASNDSLSMFDEMRFLLDEFPQVFSPAEALEMASLGAARAIHLDRDAGSLENGKRADFLVVTPVRSAPADQIAEAVLEESKIEQIYLRGEALDFDALDGYKALQGPGE